MINDGAHVLAVALGVEFFLTGGLVDLVAGGVEVEIADRAVKAALDALEQQAGHPRAPN